MQNGFFFLMLQEQGFFPSRCTVQREGTSGGQVAITGTRAPSQHWLGQRAASNKASLLGDDAFHNPRPPADGTLHYPGVVLCLSQSRPREQ